MDKKRVTERALEVIDTEIEGLKSLKEIVNDAFLRVIDIITKAKGNLVISGMGKSGHVAAKIAATLSSTGTKAYFVHPSEALHGDLGMIAKEDVVIMISNSGNSKELGGIINYCLSLNIPLIGITANLNSDLARGSTEVLLLPKFSEACPFGKAPTTSTTMSMVLGDTIAMVLLEIKGFKEEDFKILHPGGSIGNSLLKIKEVMHKDKELPVIDINSNMKEALIEITSKKFGILAVIDNDNMVGVVTDGDIRRHMSDNFLNLPVKEVMTKDFTYMNEESFVSKVISVMNTKKITNVFILENNKLKGLVNIYDLINLGVYNFDSK